MAKYVKPLKTIEVSTYNDSFEVADESKNRKATIALDEFLEEQTMVLALEGNKTYVPFHAVITVESEVVPTETDYADPYGCDGGGGGTSSKACEGKACEMKLC